MKKILILSIVAISVLVAAVAFATVLGSKHDVSATSGISMCQNCHHPHTGNAASVNKLWNLNGGQDATGGSYQTYGNGTLDATSGFASWACMSCHDGAMGANTLYKGANLAVALTTGDLIETVDTMELQNDHPVNDVFPAAGDYVATAPDPATSVWLYTSAGVKLASGAATPGVAYVQCASCHDVHNGSASVAVPMLRVSQAASLLCTTCHVK